MACNRRFEPALQTVLLLSLCGQAALAQPAVTQIGPGGAPRTVQVPLGPSSAAQSEAPVDPKEQCTLEGIATNAITGEPVRRVNLTISVGFDRNSAKTAVTGDDGKFSFTGLRPGTYRLRADKPGFLNQEYNTRNAGAFPGQPGNGTPITLSAGQKMTDIAFKLIPQGIVAGKILDEEGEPVQQAQVSLMRYIFNRGKRRLLPASNAQTNDLGEFRIANVAPGKYYLQAINMRRMMMMPGSPAPPSPDGKPERAQMPTLYPGVAEVTSASEIVVAPGQEVGGINFSLQSSEVFRIRGKVTSSDGSPLGQVFVSTMPRGTDQPMGFPMGGVSSGVKPDGTFELANVRPGSYYVRAARVGQDRGMRAVARVPVDVSHSSVEGVVLNIGGTGASLKGVVRLETANGVTPLAAQVVLMDFDLDGMSSANTQTKDDGTFSIDDVSPGRYRVIASPRPGMGGTITPMMTSYLKSIKTGQQEVLESGLVISEGEASSIEILFSEKAASLTGLVVDDGKPVPGVSVVPIPEPFDPDTAVGAMTIRQTQSDQNGSIQIQGLRPGKYRVFAFDRLEMGEFSDLDLLKKHESAAEKVDLKENSTATVSLKLIKREQ